MAEKTIYQHHERTTTAALEAGLYLREIGIDPVLKMLTAYSEVLATKIHAVTQESPAVQFAGTLGVTGAVTLASTLAVTGAATISSTLTFTDATANINFSASDGSDNGRLTLTAAGGTNGNTDRGSYISLRGNENASPGAIQIVGGNVVGGDIDFYTGNAVRRGGFAYAGAFDVVGAATLASTATTTGVHTFTAAPVFTSATASLPMFTNGSKGLVSNAMTGTGSVMMSVSPASTGTATFVNTTNSGTLGVTGAVTLASTLTGATQISTTGSLRTTGNNAAGFTGLGVEMDVISGTTGRIIAYNRTTSAYAPLSIGINMEITAAGAVSMGSTLAVTGATTLASTLVVAGVATLSSHVRVQGTNATGFTGSGVEVDFGSVASTGRIFAYDRTASVFLPFRIGTNMDITAAGAVSMGLTLAVTSNISTASGFIYNPGIAKPGFLIGSAGSNYGYFGNINSTTWALGYSASQTVLGTSALTWTDGGAVTVPGTLGVTGGIIASDTLTVAAAITANGYAEFNAATYFDGGITTVASVSDSFYEKGTFTATLVGVTGTVTGTATFVKVGAMVTIHWPRLSGTSNSTGFQVSGMPTRLRPSSDVTGGPFYLVDNGVALTSAVGGGYIAAGGGIIFLMNNSTSGFTNTGTKSIEGIGVNNHPTTTTHMIS